MSSLLAALRNALGRRSHVAHDGARATVDPTTSSSPATLVAPAALRVLEESLDVPIRDVLSLMQRRIVTETTYFGVPALKCPTDFWVYQEIIWAMKPDVIVEIGNWSGGGTLAFAHLCDLIGKGRVVGLDLSHEKVPDLVRQHPRITLIEGDACANFGSVASGIAPTDRVLVVEDSSHTFENTLNVLRTYSPLTRPGDYFIVEDGICRHGLADGPSPGPYEAVEAFVRENPTFEIDRTRESFLITWNPKGFLRRREG